jgi:predicted DNA-binding transcriptional regulator AlpA
LPGKNDHAAPPASDVWLSNRDLAERYTIPIKTVYHWRQTGYGPRGVRFGGHVRYALAEVRRWERQRAKEDPYAQAAS